MRIACLVSTFPPYKGGMGNVAYHQARELAALGHQVSIFTPAYEDNNASTREQDNIQINYIKPLLKFGNAAVLPKLAKRLKNFDLIYLHWPFLGGAENIIFNAKKLPPLIVKYHMDLKDSGWRGLFFAIYQKLFLPIVFKKAKKIIVSSLDYLKNSNMGKFYFSRPETFSIIPIGVENDIFFPRSNQQELKNKLNFGTTDQVILFVAGLDRPHYFKGLSILLQAMARLPETIKLVIVGDGGLRLAYENETEQLGIGRRTIFVGAVKNEELPSFYNLCDIFVLPSISASEAFGLVSLEAMASQKPIIVSDLPGMRTLVEEGRNGFLVKPGDIDDLAKKILILSEDKELRSKYGLAGRKMTEELYNWQKVGAKLESLFSNVLVQRKKF